MIDYDILADSQHYLNTLLLSDVTVNGQGEAASLILVTEAPKQDQLAESSLIYGLCTVCRGLFAFPLGVICRPRSVIVALYGHLYYFCNPSYCKNYINLE